jgi:tetratricopeptide (TPR) repeat protein
MRKTTASIIGFFLFLNLTAQRGIDSLRHLLREAKEDTTRVNLLNKIASGYAESRPDSTLKYASDALKLSGQTKYKKGEIEAIRNLGGAFIMAGDYSKALEYAIDALKKSEALNDKDLVASNLWAIGVVYGFKGDYAQAQDYMLKSNKIYEEMHSDLDMGRTL